MECVYDLKETVEIISDLLAEFDSGVQDGTFVSREEAILYYVKERYPDDNHGVAVRVITALADAHTAGRRASIEHLTLQN